MTLQCLICNCERVRIIFCPIKTTNMTTQRKWIKEKSTHTKKNEHTKTTSERRQSESNKYKTPKTLSEKLCLCQSQSDVCWLTMYEIIDGCVDVRETQVGNWFCLPQPSHILCTSGGQFNSLFSFLLEFCCCCSPLASYEFTNIKYNIVVDVFVTLTSSLSPNFEWHFMSIFHCIRRMNYN